MTTKATRITKDKLTEDYPKIAKIVDKIYENDKKANYWFYVNYCGKYTDKEGNPRAVSMGAVIELLHSHGYVVSISAKRSLSNKKIL